MTINRILTRTGNDSFKGLSFSYVCDFTSEKITETIIEEVFTNNFQCESGAIYGDVFIYNNHQN